jgi:hypothetical protein
MGLPSLNIYTTNFEDVLELDSSTRVLLKEKKIYFTFAYIGLVRCYKHEHLIWQASTEFFCNEFGCWSYDEKVLIEKAKECVKYFLEHGYIPSMDRNL